jgi:hypothetical protein
MVKSMYGVLHTDSQPMTLPCTTGRNDLLYNMTRTRRYRDVLTGDLIAWSGDLEMPEVVRWYRRYFNAVVLFNRLCTGPNSTAQIISRNETLKIFGTFVAMTETNAYCAFMQ